VNVKPRLPPPLLRALTRREPLLWVNEGWKTIKEARVRLPFDLDHVRDAGKRLKRFENLLTALFPELKTNHGVIDSPLLAADGFQRVMMANNPSCCDGGRWAIKADHLLPVAGSIKARGGIYEVLLHADALAQREGLMMPQDDPQVLVTPAARALFARHRIAVGSTGNLGLSIGIAAAALGFRAVVHMSADARAWKKRRLRDHGVEVVEHSGDFGAAVAAGRGEAQSDPSTYFVDDEHSQDLFFGYSVAALHLQRQLEAQGIRVDREHPLFVYVPCGVGGGPGGITFGLRQLLGDAVHCFFAEPTASPAMLIRLANIEDQPISVREIGLDNRTEADGLAVAQASEFVAPLIRPLVGGIFTVPDEHLFEDLYRLERSERLRIEPSAAAGLRGPQMLLNTTPGREYLISHGCLHHLEEATHVLWTTGGAFMPDEEYRSFFERGRARLCSESL
jgi:D-serine dehydratase